MFWYVRPKILVHKQKGNCHMAMSILFGVGPNHKKGPRQKGLLGEFLNAKLKNINSFLSKSKVTKDDIREPVQAKKD